MSGSKTDKKINYQDEKWKKFPLKNLNNIYMVSNYGRLKNDKNKILKPALRSGYYSYSLNVDGKNKGFKIHRLVAKLFVKNDDHDRNVVNHIDGNKLNNYYKNLEWTTLQQNNQHAMDTGLIKKTVRKVGQYKNNKLIKEFETLSQAAKEIGVNTGRIVEVCKGRRDQIGGYQWRYLDQSSQDAVIDPKEQGYKKIEGFANYWINNEGKIYSTHSKRYMKFQKNSDGRYCIQLSYQGKATTYLVHRLVAQYFLVKKDAKYNSVSHIDGDYSNNNVTNLKWVYVPVLKQSNQKWQNLKNLNQD